MGLNCVLHLAAYAKKQLVAGFQRLNTLEIAERLRVFGR